MNAAVNIRPEAVQRTVVVPEARENADLELRVAILADIYRRRVWPVLIASASILGAVVAIAQLVKWIGR